LIKEVFHKFHRLCQGLPGIGEVGGIHEGVVGEGLPPFEKQNLTMNFMFFKYFRHFNRLGMKPVYLAGGDKNGRSGKGE